MHVILIRQGKYLMSVIRAIVTDDHSSCVRNCLSRMENLMRHVCPLPSIIRPPLYVSSIILCIN